MLFPGHGTTCHGMVGLPLLIRFASTQAGSKCGLPKPVFLRSYSIIKASPYRISAREHKLFSSSRSEELQQIRFFGIASEIRRPIIWPTTLLFKGTAIRERITSVSSRGTEEKRNYSIIG